MGKTDCKKKTEGIAVVSVKASAVLNLDRAGWAKMSVEQRAECVAENFRCYMQRVFEDCGGDKEVAGSFIDDFSVIDEVDE